MVAGEVASTLSKMELLNLIVDVQMQDVTLIICVQNYYVVT